jgi:hypothetical protein
MREACFVADQHDDPCCDRRVELLRGLLTHDVAQQRERRLGGQRRDGEDIERVATERSDPSVGDATQGLGERKLFPRHGAFLGESAHELEREERFPPAVSYTRCSNGRARLTPRRSCTSR